MPEAIQETIIATVTRKNDHIISTEFSRIVASYFEVKIVLFDYLIQPLLILKNQFFNFFLQRILLKPCTNFSFPSVRRAEFRQATSIRRRKNVHKAFI